MVPAALTLRMVMGKQTFDNWVTSMQVTVPTSFSNEHEIIRTVRKAGYDTEKLAGSIITDLDFGRSHFFWEHINGQWTAVFSKSDSKQKIEVFINDLNKAVGRQIIDRGTLSETRNNSLSAFPTNFRDGELLFKTLKELGINPTRRGSEIVCKVEQSHLTFRQSGDHPFQVEIHNAPDLRKVFEYLSDIDADYRRCLQEAVYKKLKARTAEQNIAIESEEVLEDNSIVLTLNIGAD
ncbi:hypothetical protein DX130_16790 [Paenibacillus paeoniae]|uniref:DUF1257 domain-containing protein n=2 Tax=Paenibacillus paeoniae TaxID=2292705 RepID=A0A371PE55_9BACL|nr:hypothetical protein DX130_16790 [Paenibacillus paeoniae]